jgi:hypothetical protein
MSNVSQMPHATNPKAENDKSRKHVKLQEEHALAKKSKYFETVR